MAANMQQYRELIRRRVRVYFSRESQIHDVTQEALLEFIDKLQALEERALEQQHAMDPATFAINIARNAVRREYTRLRRLVVKYESQVHGLVESNHAERLDAREDLRRINALFSEEQEEHQVALASTLAGGDHNEIAEELGISPGAARMTLSRARANLHKGLSAQQKISRLKQLAKSAGLLDEDSKVLR